METITNWETGRRTPKIKHYPSIIQFLGYIPLDFDLSTFGGKLKFYRVTKGLSHRKMGKLINRDASTIANWEKEFTPSEVDRTLLENLLNLVSKT